MTTTTITPTAPLGCQSPFRQVYIYEAQTGQPFLVVDMTAALGVPPTISPDTGWAVRQVGDPDEQGWLCTPSAPGTYTVNGQAVTVVAAAGAIGSPPADPGTIACRNIFVGGQVDGAEYPKWNSAVPPAPPNGAAGAVFVNYDFANVQFCEWAAFPGARFFGCTFANCQFSGMPYNWHFDRCTFTGPRHSMILGPSGPGQCALTNCQFLAVPRGFVWQFTSSPQTLSGYFIQHNRFVHVGGPWREGQDEVMAGESGATNSQCVLANSVIANNTAEDCTGPFLQLWQMRATGLLVAGNRGRGVDLADPPGAIGPTYISCTFVDNWIEGGRFKGSAGCQGLSITGAFFLSPGPLSDELTETPGMVPPVVWLPAGGGNVLAESIVSNAPASMLTCNDPASIGASVFRWQ